MNEDDVIIPAFPSDDLMNPSDSTDNPFYNTDNPFDTTNNPSSSINKKGNQPDLRKIYEEEKKPQGSSKEYEAQCLQHLGPLAYYAMDVSLRDVSTREISCQTDTEELFLQAASLVKPSIWREDGYLLKVLNQGARPNILTNGDFGRLRHFEDKHNVECYVEYGEQRFVHQYRWHDQSLHLYENVFTCYTRVVSKRRFGNYDDVIKELVNKEQAPLSRLQELADGSQKYIRLRYTFPASSFVTIFDDHVFYLFSDGHVYDPYAGYRSNFKRILSDNVEQTMRFIVKQIIALNEHNKWNIDDVSVDDLDIK